MATSTRPSYSSEVDPADPTGRNEPLTPGTRIPGRAHVPSPGMSTGWILLAVLVLIVAAILVGYGNSYRVSAPAGSGDTTSSQTAPAMPDATGTPDPAAGSQPSGEAGSTPQPPAAIQPAPPAPAPSDSQPQQQ